MLDWVLQCCIAEEYATCKSYTTGCAKENQLLHTAQFEETVILQNIEKIYNNLNISN